MGITTKRIIKKIKYNQIGVMLVTAIILIAHIVALRYVPISYDWHFNTISDLASQQYNYGWIMESGFIAFGSIFILGITCKFILKKATWHVDLPILFFAIFILLTGVIRTRPFFHVDSYSKIQDSLHAIVAIISGIALCIGVFCHVFPLKEKTKKSLIIDFTVFILMVILLIIFEVGDVSGYNYKGIIQKSLWLLGTLWLALIYNRKASEEKPGFKILNFPAR